MSEWDMATNSISDREILKVESPVRQWGLGCVCALRREMKVIKRRGSNMTEDCPEHIAEEQGRSRAEGEPGAVC